MFSDCHVIPREGCDRRDLCCEIIIIVVVVVVPRLTLQPCGLLTPFEASLPQRSGVELKLQRLTGVKQLKSLTWRFCVVS